MILGIGSDITDVRRIAKVVERHGERFLDRVFTATERTKADKRRNRMETYAKRFAAKEACAKALGTGLRAGVWSGRAVPVHAAATCDAAALPPVRVPEHASNTERRAARSGFEASKAAGLDSA